MATVQKYKTVAIPLGLWKEITHIVEGAGMYSNEAEFVREAIRNRLGQVSIVKTSSVAEGKVEEEVVRYITEKGKAYPSDITADLGIPYFVVVEVIGKLVKEDRLEPVGE